MRLPKTIWLFLWLIPAVVAGTVIPWMIRADYSSGGTTNTTSSSVLSILNPAANAKVSGVLGVNIYAPTASAVTARLVQSTTGSYFYMPTPALGTVQGVWATSLDTRRIPDGTYSVQAQGSMTGLATTSTMAFASVTIMISNYALTTYTAPTPTPTPSPVTTTVSGVAATASPLPTLSTTLRSPSPTLTPNPVYSPQPSASPVPVSTQAVRDEVAKLEQTISSTTEPIITEPKAVQERLEQVAKQISFTITNVDLHPVAAPTETEDSVAPSPKAAAPTPLQPKAGTENNKAVSINIHVGIPNWPVTLTVHSDVLTIMGTTDSNGNFVYILDSPLDPGKHSATLSVIDPQTNEKVDKTSSFFISKVVAASSLNGQSLVLEDPGQVLMRQYLAATAGVVLLCILVMSWIFYRRSKVLPKESEEATTAI